MITVLICDFDTGQKLFKEHGGKGVSYIETFKDEEREAVVEKLSEVEKVDVREGGAFTAS